MSIAPLQASTRFYPGFTLLRHSSSGFRSFPCDSSQYHDVPRRSCGRVGFPSTSQLKISLATEKNSLARFSKRMMQLLRAASYYNFLSSESFHSLLRVLFCIPSQYSYTIGLGKYLGLEVTDSYICTRIPTRTTLR